MAGKLKPLDVARETRRGKFADGDGLYLVVASPTAKSSSYRYFKDGRPSAPMPDRVVSPRPDWF